MEGIPRGLANCAHRVLKGPPRVPRGRVICMWPIVSPQTDGGWLCGCVVFVGRFLHVGRLQGAGGSGDHEAVAKPVNNSHADTDDDDETSEHDQPAFDDSPCGSPAPIETEHSEASDMSDDKQEDGSDSEDSDEDPNDAKKKKGGRMLAKQEVKKKVKKETPKVKEPAAKAKGGSKRGSCGMCKKLASQDPSITCLCSMRATMRVTFHSLRDPRRPMCSGML